MSDDLVDGPVVVPEALDGERVDRAVSLLTGFSRGDVEQLVGAEAVLVNGAPVVKSFRLSAGDRLALTAEPTPPGLPVAEPVDLDVRYEDDDVVVISKASGIVVHPGAGNETGTLVNGLLHRCPEISTVGDPARPGIVHRLDRDTSGLLVVAKSEAAYEVLVRMLADRRVMRRYVALVSGVPDPPRGVVDAPVGRSARRRTRMAVTPGGREARTSYEVTETLGPYALLDVSLETGRTHQIRVHLSAIGHAVVGDRVYGIVVDGGPPRTFLHASRLAFDHPVRQERVDVSAELPGDLASFLEDLRAGHGGSR